MSPGKRSMTMTDEERLDCLIVGGGPAGLTAALYLARFNRRFLVVDGGQARASWIPTSHNIPLFAEGIGGPDILARQRDSVEQYGPHILKGHVSALHKRADGFTAEIQCATGKAREVRARRVLLATGAVDIEPDLPDLPDAIQRGLVRYCPICDGYEARNRKIAVIGHGDRGLGEAVFLARTYSRDVTLLTLGQGMNLDKAGREKVKEHAIKVVEEPIAALDQDGHRILAIRTRSGTEHRFDILYSALGIKIRSDLAIGLGAEHDEAGALIVDDHNRTSVSGLYAAGDVVRALSQIVVGMGHAAVAATDIHNRCELPTEDEPEWPTRARAEGS
ncbi:NAD(P)/FAD-dependent oxidoreductase [Falsirhodobacter sp. 1013]|uniref:NAD(P)/FAD-dependent oxidoreductase n=1 Tax=Falsirhodobacter sp. 1013 TaxID=3417566 RepID=UPI003EB716AE